MIRCSIEEDNEALLARFFGGLNNEIETLLEYMEYTTITRLFHLACKAEPEVQDRQPWRRTNNSAGRTTPWSPRPPPSARGATASPSTSKFSASTLGTPPAAAPPSTNGLARSSSSSMASTGKSKDI